MNKREFKYIKSVIEACGLTDKTLRNADVFFVPHKKHIAMCERLSGTFLCKIADGYTLSQVCKYHISIGYIKRTKSQLRYEIFLGSSADWMSFGDWIKSGAYKNI